ncbi:MAG: hypothetical protein R3F20_18570 [Planctomycetota bacterium]
MQLAASALLLRNETVRPFVNEVVEKILDSESRPATLLLLAVEFYRAMKSPEARRMLERISLDEKIGEENVREQAREALAEYLSEESVGTGE